jgi:hypothetical protein
MRLLVLWLVRLFEFSLLVALVFIAESTADFLACMARGYHSHTVNPFDFGSNKGLIGALGFAVALVIGRLLISLLGQERVLKDFKDFDFKNQTITVIGAIIVSALIMGYCFPPICSEKPEPNQRQTHGQAASGGQI